MKKTRKEKRTPPSFNPRALPDVSWECVFTQAKRDHGISHAKKKKNKKKKQSGSQEGLSVVWEGGESPLWATTRNFKRVEARQVLDP